MDANQSAIIRDHLSEDIHLWMSEKKGLACFDDNYSLFCGIGGWLLSQALQMLEGRDNQDDLEEAIQAMLKHIASKDSLSPTLCDGLAGQALFLMYLKDNDILFYNEQEFFFHIDQYLASCMQYYLMEGNWDFLHGALGLSMYFLKRGNTTQIRLMIDYLEKSAVEDQNELKWPSHLRAIDAKAYDFGLAHGNASILGFFTLCIENNVQDDRLQRLTTGSINFYKNNIQRMEGMSFFPGYIPLDAYYNENTLQHSRLGWCYGDLGILNILHKSSSILNHQTDTALWLEMLKETTIRTAPGNTLISDTGLCHGTSGVALIFDRIYERTGVIEFKHTSEFWLQETRRLIGENVLSILALEHEDNRHLDFLDGICGISSFLTDRRLKCKETSPQISKWSDIMLI
ncbi:lanthionine synthetase LanC family protein [Pedobacter sp. Leaf216]|uniref:lanthionine synthetase LanC family protein n=1 Tax=Pedobacter sp. Leaf216 TaxID=1735684 RepID=UPI0009E992EC|nr:lanthionine synthetase LanC family protein [Pedobacter sp. Leaf216]